MLEANLLGAVDYLLIGHLTVDETPLGMRLGGTVTYAGLMAQALGLRVGIVTSWGNELPLDPLNGIPVASFPTERSTTFENIDTPQGRIQYLRHVAPSLDYYHIPEPWRQAGIVHLAPVAQEVEPGLARNFPSALIGVTPQGWLRTWGKGGLVYKSEWPEASFVLQRAGATVVSVEDLENDENRIDEMAALCRILAVTEGPKGVRLFWNGDVRRFRPPNLQAADPTGVVDTTGAGDIFSACFFARLYTTRDPWEAARFATRLSAISVRRPGLASIPTSQEIEACMTEVY